MLHRVAATYSTDPMTVLGWPPVRLGLAVECLAAGDAARNRAVAGAANGGLIFPVVEVGGRY